MYVDRSLMSVLDSSNNKVSCVFSQGATSKPRDKHEAVLLQQ